MVTVGDRGESGLWGSRLLEGDWEKQLKMVSTTITAANTRCFSCRIFADTLFVILIMREKDTGDGENKDTCQLRIIFDSSRTVIGWLATTSFVIAAVKVSN